MTKTVPADYIGKPNLGYMFVALPSEETKERITSLLSELTAELPDVLWPMPPEQLHITLCEIIQPKGYSQDKETLYNLHKTEYETVPAQMMSTTPRFTVMLDTIEAGPQAIIVKASDSSNFNAIRARLTASMQLPDETRTPPDITHSSIARYLKEIDLERVQEVVARHSITIGEEVSEFKLVRTEIPPLQKYDVLGTYPLAAD